MQLRTLLGFAAMALFTSAPVLLASGCSDDEDTGENQGALCSTEGAYACENNVLMRCTDGVMTTIEDCGMNECEADAGHCHMDGEHHDHGHDEHHDHGHDEHHDHGHDEHHDHGHDEHGM